MRLTAMRYDASGAAASLMSLDTLAATEKM